MSLFEKKKEEKTDTFLSYLLQQIMSLNSKNLKAAKNKLSVNFAGPLPLESTVDTVAEKCLFY